MIPRKLGRIAIGSRTIEVWEMPDCRDDAGDPAHGTWHEDKSIIEIHAGDPPDVKASTLLHERIHAVSDIYGLGLSEEAVCALEQGLRQSETVF